IGEKKKIVTRLEHALKVVICKSVGKQENILAQKEYEQRDLRISFTISTIFIYIT
ncbi:hypothetical protein A2U01_0032616, partial [Trifolium medium]|nr:hypothetical protein [Trifolium medium]